MPADPACSELLTGFRRLLQSGQLSDLTIRSTEREYAVHKAVVCSQSAFFWAACLQGFKEQTCEMIDLRNDDPNAVHCMIQYFYTLIYPNVPGVDDPTPTVAVIEDVPKSNYRGENVVSIAEEVIDNTDRADIGQLDATEDAIQSVESTPLSTSNVLPAIDGEHHRDTIEIRRNLTLAHLRQDLLVYAMSDKFSIPNLKKQAAHHFEKELQEFEISMDIFEIVREVYSTTPPQDRGLRDIVIVKVYGEVQHWVTKDQFLTALSTEGEFCADLLAQTVKEDAKQYEAALAKIEHPGYCDKCRATLILRQTLSRKKNIRIEKYCARCEPWY